ncbi:MAG: hypothetical protein H0X17_21780 [Deltaproteobacteria bacterium]|nr:hypothetical protein [Deltaproteobacteria bacterium]
MSWARGATYALAITLCAPFALAEPTREQTKKSLAACTAFDQVDGEDDTVQFTIHNTCSIPVDCAVSWRLICAPDTKKRRAAHPGAAKLTLVSGKSLSAAASAAVCGDDGWTIDQINWSCQPNKD